MRNHSKGFTLVEVLIVVVIIAILASLTVPRFFMQTKRAESAEALQMIGVLKRTLEQNIDMGMGGTYRVGTLDMGGMYDTSDSAWQKFGLKKPSSSKWNYALYYKHEENQEDGYYAIAFNANNTNALWQYSYPLGADGPYTCYGDTAPVYAPGHQGDSNYVIGCELA